MTRIAIQGLAIDRGNRRVLNRIDCAFEPGMLNVLIGPNGAGKSTLLAAAAGLLVPADGRAMWDHLPVQAISPRERARRRGYLPQRAGVEWPISVERVVALGLTPSLPVFGGLPPALARQIASVLSAYDLADLAERPATSLSGGELARVMLARATVGEPAILIADEPVAGLDPRHALDAMARLRLLADNGCNVVLALHDLDLAVRFADRIVALKDGALLARGPTKDVMTPAVLGPLFDLRVTLSDAGAVRYDLM